MIYPTSQWHYFLSTQPLPRLNKPPFKALTFRPLTGDPGEMWKFRCRTWRSSDEIKGAPSHRRGLLDHVDHVNLWWMIDYIQNHIHIIFSHSTSESSIGVHLFFWEVRFALLWSSWSQELCQKTDSANIVSEMLKLVDDASVARWLCGLTTVNEIGQCHLIKQFRLGYHPIGSTCILILIISNLYPGIDCLVIL